MDFIRVRTNPEPPVTIRSLLPGRLEDALRMLAAVVIVTSMALVMWVKHPEEATSEEFLAGVAGGSISSVDYDVDDLRNIYLRRRASNTWREAKYEPQAWNSPGAGTGEDIGAWNPGGMVRADLRARAAEGPDSVHIGRYPSTHSETAIDRLLVAADVFYLPWTRLKWAVVALGGVLICVMLSRRPTRYRRRIHWVVLSLATGVGFLAYLWLEAPGRRAAAVTTTPARMRRDRAAIACVAVAGILVVTGI